jgi:uncharacterized membrane protein
MPAVSGERTTESQSKKSALGRYRTKRLALAAALAGVYAASTIALGSISYGAINLRLSNILVGIVPILGFPAVAGLSLGVFIANITSPLGPIDLLSAIFAFVGLSAVYLLRKKSVALGLSIHAVVIALWVTFELSFVLKVPYLPLLYFVVAGNSIVDALAYFFYKALAGSGLKRRFEHALG